MSQFATELLVPKSFASAAFAAQVLAWIRGMKHGTRLFDGLTPEVLAGDDIRLTAPEGEALMLRALGRDGDWQATGCQYDYVDPDRRLWRTEAVLRALPGRGNLLRVRAQCLAVETLVRLEVPKRTHLIRAIIEEGHALPDGALTPSTRPVMLTDDDAGLTLAGQIVTGGATDFLPTVYVSAKGQAVWALSRKAINKLALDLAGVAHVVVEPSREFSFDLRDRVAGRNVYGGTIGLATAGEGVVQRFYLGAVLPDEQALVQKVQAGAIALRSRMPSLGGWDWLDLQDEILRRHSEADRHRLSSGEIEKLWQEELALKEARIAELQAELEEARKLPPPELAGDAVLPWRQDLLPEIYRGEMSDRIRAALAFCLEKGTDAGWDKRSLAVFENLLAASPAESELEEFREELKRATRDQARLNTAVKHLMTRHGFIEKSENSHSKLEPLPEYPGLDSITLMKTPSENRGLKNLKSQIEANLGLTQLKKLL